MQERNWGRGVENGLADTVGQESVEQMKTVASTGTPSRVKQTAGEKLLEDAASAAWHSDDVEGWEGRGEGGYVDNYG